MKRNSIAAYLIERWWASTCIFDKPGRQAWCEGPDFQGSWRFTPCQVSKQLPRQSWWGLLPLLQRSVSGMPGKNCTRFLVKIKKRSFISTIAYLLITGNFLLARTRGNEKRHQFVRVRKAKTFVKKGEGSLFFRMNQVKDLEKIVRMAAFRLNIQFCCI